MDEFGFPGGFVPPIFAPGGAHSDGSRSLGEHDLDDIFVDDFLSSAPTTFGLPDAPELPPMPSTSSSASFPAPPVQPPSQPPTPVDRAVPVANMASGTDGFAVLQRSAAGASEGTHPNAATLASIASNPSTSRSVAQAALAASKAAEKLDADELQPAAASGTSSSRTRRSSARAASAMIKEVAGEGGRRSTKRPLEGGDAGAGEGGEDEDEEEGEGDSPSSKPSSKRKRALNASERQARSRERNRVHARKSRLRKKFFVDSLKSNLTKLENENTLMRQFLKQHTGRSFEELAAAAGAPAAAAASSGDEGLLAGSGRAANRQLENPDYKLVQALTVSQQNFVVSDPNLPDNPIVFASAGFYRLTGYSASEVIGRNCRFLQGPGTDPTSIAIIREGIAAGKDVATCLINYRKDGTPFWNQFFVAPLRGVDGRIVNFVGVQCEVSEDIAKQSLAAARMASAHGRVPQRK